MTRMQLWITTAAMLLTTSPALALEKVAARISDQDADFWRAGSTTCAVSYFNTCAGYVWLWSDFGADTELGMQIDQCCADAGQPIATLQTVHWNGAPSGYGFTGSVNLYVDSNGNTCPDETAFFTAAFLPTESGAGAEFVDHAVNLTGGTSIIASVIIGGTGNPVSLPSDQGSQPCVPARSNHSYIWGAPATAICPGSTLVAVTDPCEWLWQIGFGCVVSVEQNSWTEIKALYR